MRGRRRGLRVATLIAAMSAAMVVHAAAPEPPGPTLTEQLIAALRMTAATPFRVDLAPGSGDVGPIEQSLSVQVAGDQLHIDTGFGGLVDAELHVDGARVYQRIGMSMLVDPGLGQRPPTAAEVRAALPPMSPAQAAAVVGVMTGSWMLVRQDLPTGWTLEDQLAGLNVTGELADDGGWVHVQAPRWAEPAEPVSAWLLGSVGPYVPDLSPGSTC